MRKPLTTAEAAERLGVEARTIRNWLRNGTLTGEKIGDRLHVPEDAVTRIAGLLDRTVTAAEAVARLGVSRSTLHAHVEQGRLRGEKFAGRTRIDKASLAALERLEAITLRETGGQSWHNNH